MNQIVPVALTDRFKVSFKLALSMVIAYGFALWFQWDRPHWAALAIALISLSTLDESLAKGGQRLWGTLLAVPVSLSLIALFSQDRWLFMLAEGAWLAFRAYRMSSGRNAYLWFCAGFVTAVIAINGGPDPISAFSVAVNRTLQTSLGIVCYALVFSLLWPVRAVVPETTEESRAAPAQVFPDIDRAQQAARVFLAFCIAFIIVIYFPHFPGAYGFLAMFAPFAIIVGNSPQMQPIMLFKPVMFSIIIAAPFHILLMPVLNGFVQLAPMIFGVTFVICYVLHQPKQEMGRTFGLAFFAVVTGISNEQTYSFLPVVNTALMFGLLVLLLTLTASIPVSNQPEKVCLRLIARFLRSANYLAGDSDHRSDFADRYLRAFHRYEVDTIPGKLNTWRERIPAEVGVPLTAELEKLDRFVVDIADMHDKILEDDDHLTQVALDELEESYADMDISILTQARF
jgi:uncharacterized membrane protein YccC